MELRGSAADWDPGTSPRYTARCPICRRQGTLDVVLGGMLMIDDNRQVGIRRCPNPNCAAILFVAHDRVTNEVLFHPAEVIDFDTEGIPEPVSRALKESIICHANECYMAAAVMVRKTLEELCADRGAEGSTLYDRIETLREKVIIPSALLNGLHGLRLLGNDAVHVELKDFDDVGEEEATVGIEVVKEVLKAVYQMDTLVSRLDALRRTDSA